MIKSQRTVTRLALAFSLLLIIALSTAASLNAADNARPMQSHDFTDVPVAGQEFMEPFINEFFHQGITGGCSVTPLMYCPSNPVTRGSMAVFIGRALGYVDMVDDGHSARAYFKQTALAPTAHGVMGSSVNGQGVSGYSDTGIGVNGGSDSGAGVNGTSFSGTGVNAASGSFFGLQATSNTGTAIFAAANNLNADSTADTAYDLQLGGSIGEIFAGSLFLFGSTGTTIVSNGNVSMDLDDNAGSNSTFTIRNDTNTIIFTVTEDGDMLIAGDLNVTGTKNNLVDTVHYGERLLYAVESTEYWFEDIGRGKLRNGAVTISIDAIYAETVNLNEDYEVFLTPIGDWADLYIAEMTATSFTVRAADGTSNIEFSYRIVAKRLGYEDVRLEQPED